MTDSPYVSTQWDGHVVDLGALWTLRKEGRLAVCFFCLTGLDLNGGIAMSEKVTVAVELEPGSYLVDVVKYPTPRARVWKHEGNGVFVGHGGKLRRAAIAYALNELVAAAERQEEIER